MIFEIDESNIDEFVDENKYALVGFTAPWCGPCKRLDPLMEELSDELKGKVAMAKLNVDKSPGISDRLSVVAIPTIFFFKDGAIVQTVVGIRSKEDFLAALASHGMTPSKGKA